MSSSSRKKQSTGRGGKPSSPTNKNGKKETEHEPEPHRVKRVLRSSFVHGCQAPTFLELPDRRSKVEKTKPSANKADTPLCGTRPRMKGLPKKLPFVPAPAKDANLVPYRKPQAKPGYQLGDYLKFVVVDQQTMKHRRVSLDGAQENRTVGQIIGFGPGLPGNRDIHLRSVDTDEIWYENEANLVEPVYRRKCTSKVQRET
jgi:hypothetical protein